MKSLYGVSFLDGRRFAAPPPFTRTDDLVIHRRCCPVQLQRLVDTLRGPGIRCCLAKLGHAK